MTGNKIIYTIRENTINKQAGERFVAKVIRNVRTIDQAGLVREMVRKNTTVSRQDVIAVLDLFREVLIEKLQQGYNINTDLFNAHVAIKGTFADREENFSPVKHTLKVNLVPARPLTGEVKKNARLCRQEIAPAAPAVTQYKDLGTGTENRKLTPGFIGEIRGSQLEMDSRREDHGLWFVAARAGWRIKVREVHRQTKRKILFTIPAALEPGEYFIEFAGGRTSRVKTSRMMEVLRVEQAAAA